MNARNGSLRITFGFDNTQCKKRSANNHESRLRVACSGWSTVVVGSPARTNAQTISLAHRTVFSSGLVNFQVRLKLWPHQILKPRLQFQRMRRLKPQPAIAPRLKLEALRVQSTQHRLWTRSPICCTALEERSWRTPLGGLQYVPATLSTFVSTAVRHEPTPHQLQNLWQMQQPTAPHEGWLLLARPIDPIRNVHCRRCWQPMLLMCMSAHGRNNL